MSWASLRGSSVLEEEVSLSMKGIVTACIYFDTY